MNKQNPKRRKIVSENLSYLLLMLISLLFVIVYRQQNALHMSSRSSHIVWYYSSLQDNTTSTTENIIFETSDFLSTVHGSNPTGGTTDYVADPTALKQGIIDFLNNHPETVNDITHGSAYWSILKDYGMEIPERNHVPPQNVRLDVIQNENWKLPEEHTICSSSPGDGLEGKGGYNLLTKKVKKCGRNQQLKVESGKNSTESNFPRKIRVFCAIYTHSPMFELARTAAITWGLECDGFLGFSNETIESLGFVQLQHNGTESYGNMWQKTRSIWKYIFQHYLNDYDYFHLGGDDIYVLVDNLRFFLSSFSNEDGEPSDEPIHVGQWIRQKGLPYVAGGPGYTLNRAAVRKFVEEKVENCFPSKLASFEDRLLSKCLNIAPYDSRDPITGEQMYHDVAPDQVYTGTAGTGRRVNFHSRAIAYWESLPKPIYFAQQNNRQYTSSYLTDNVTDIVGIKNGLDAASKNSVSFHNLHSPAYMARLHAILNRNVCSLNTTLGRLYPNLI